jgi:LPXTG-motif cell wall-anchored protein
MLILSTRGISKNKNMFRKIVSNLAFSPALVSQLSFYAKRLRKEETTRRLGLVFVALALIVQSLVVFQPPESANASNPGDFIPGGLGLGANKSLNNFLGPYDQNSRHLKDVMNYFGITRAEIANAQFSSFITGTGKIGWGFEPRTGSSPVTITNASGTPVTTVHGRPLYINNGSNTRIYGWIGHSAKFGWFAIMQACGNLVTDRFPPTPPKPPEPEPAKIELSKTAVNVSQGNIVASSKAAQANDKISYTITAKNTGGTAKLTELKDNLGDILEYSTLIDKGGGTYDETTRELNWPSVNIQPGETQTRTFAVKLKASTPTTPQGQSDASSYNCLMENQFGNDFTVPVTCAPPKVIERVTKELPKTGPTENMIFAGIVLAAATYFFFRSKQLNKEVRLIRRDLNSGTI